MARPAMSSLVNGGADSPRTPSLTSEDTETSLASSVRTDLVDNELFTFPSSPVPRKASPAPRSPVPRIKSNSTNFSDGIPRERPWSYARAHRPQSRFSLVNWEFQSRLLFAALESERILTSLIGYLSWTDVSALLNSSRDMRELMRQNGLRRVILDRFVPGFRFASTAWDTRFADREPRITITHLSFLSERIFPTHPPFLTMRFCFQ
jgi:hypothetical protein